MPSASHQLGQSGCAAHDPRPGQQEQRRDGPAPARRPARDGQAREDAQPRADQHEGHGVRQRPSRQEPRQALLPRVRRDEGDHDEEIGPGREPRGLERLEEHDGRRRRGPREEEVHLRRAEERGERRDEAGEDHHDPQPPEEQGEQTEDQQQADAAERVEEPEPRVEDRVEADQQARGEGRDERDFQPRLRAQHAAAVPQRPRARLQQGRQAVNDPTVRDLVRMRPRVEARPRVRADRVARVAIPRHEPAVPYRRVVRRLQPPDQAPLQVAVPLDVAARAEEFVPLHRVVVEVEELLRAADVLEHVLPRPLPHEVEGLALAEEHVAPRLALGRREEVQPVGLRLGRTRHAGEGQARREEVGQADQAGADRTGAGMSGLPVRLRGAEDQRHARRAFVRDRLRAEVMVAEHLAVVAGEQDQRAAEEVHLAQAREEDAEVVVDLRDARVVGAARVADLRLAQAREHVELEGRLEQARRDARRVGRPVAVDGRRDFGVAVQFPVVAARIERRVRLGETRPEEERTRGVARLEEVDRAVDGPVREAVRLVHGAEGDVHLVLAEAVVHRRAEVRPRGHATVVVLEYLHLLEAVVAAVRDEVHLALRAGLVAGAGEQARQAEVGADRADVGAVRGEALPPPVPAGHDGRARGDADRAVGVGIREADARVAQPVQVRCADVRVAGRADRVEPLLVGRDEEDVRTGIHARVLTFRRCSCR